MSAGQRQVVVAGHVCLDVIPTFKHPQSGGEEPDLRPGRLVHVGPAVRSTGGAVSNTGLALHRLGTPVRLIGKIGQDLFGEEIVRLLQAQSPELADGMVRLPNEITSYSIVINPPGIDRTFLHCPGANDTFGAADVQDSSLQGACLFHFGYPPLMQRIRENNGAELVSLLRRVRSQGLTVSLDLCMVDPQSDSGRADWNTILKGALPSVDFFCPSIDELMFMLERETYGQFDADGGFTPARHITLPLLRRLAARCHEFGAGVVAIKLGDQGLYVHGSSDAERMKSLGAAVADNAAAWLGIELYSPCFQANVVGTTGSGDCTIAGLLSALVRGETPQQIMQAAVATGAASVEAADAVSGVPSWSTLEKRISAGWAQQPALLEIQ